jgi:hypothetical protein
MFYGKKPLLHFLRAIGCKCWVRLPIHKFHKYQKRSAEGVLVGYDNEKRAYRIWCPFYKEFYTSRDVRFDETTRGYHGGNNYREERSRPDDWNVVEWTNAMGFKPITEPDSPTEGDKGSTAVEKEEPGLTDTHRRVFPPKRIAQTLPTVSRMLPQSRKNKQAAAAMMKIMSQNTGISCWSQNDQTAT